MKLRHWLSFGVPLDVCSSESAVLRFAAGDLASTILRSRNGRTGLTQPDEADQREVAHWRQSPPLQQANGTRLRRPAFVARPGKLSAPTKPAGQRHQPFLQCSAQARFGTDPAGQDDFTARADDTHKLIERFFRIGNGRDDVIAPQSHRTKHPDTSDSRRPLPASASTLRGFSAATRFCAFSSMPADISSTGDTISLWRNRSTTGRCQPRPPGSARRCVPRRPPLLCGPA